MSETTPSGRVLIVDDHGDTLTLQAMLLRREGYTVETAADAATAIAIARREPVQLLVSDLRLPDRSGVELMETLRREGDVRGIALSGVLDDALVASCKRAGFSVVLQKPLSPEELIAAVASATSAP